MTDQPTYDQLSALCAQMAAALEKAELALTLSIPVNQHDVPAVTAHDKAISASRTALTAVGEKKP